MPSSLDSTARPSPWPAAAAYVAAFVLAFASSVLLVFAVAWIRVAGKRPLLLAEASAFALSAPGLMAGALANASVLAAVAFTTARLQGRPMGPKLGLGPSHASALGVVAATAGMVGLSFACGAASGLLGLRGGGVMDSMALALRAPSPVWFVTALVTIGVAPAFAEETFFRGTMQHRLIASWGRWPAIAVTSAAFGLIHLDPVQGTVAFAAGLYLGWIAARFGSIRPTVVAHMVNNTIFVTLAALGSSGDGSRAIEFGVVAVGAGVWIASVVFLRRPTASSSLA